MAGKNKTRIIAVVNEKGGVGKTVTVINLGAGLSLREKKVLVVDMDPQFNSTRGLGATLEKGQPTVYDVIKHPDPVPASSAIIHTAWENLDLLPSHVDLSGIEVELAGEPGRENRLKEALMPEVGRYDFVLLDTPPSLSLLTVNVLAFAEEILVPCQTHPFAYGALGELLETVAIIREEINPGLTITGIVPTFFDQRTRVSHQILADLRADERCDRTLLNTVVRMNTTIAESGYHNKPVVFFRQSSPGALDYLALTDEVLARG